MASIEADGGSAFAVQTDLAEPHAAEALWAAFDEHSDGADILVNNAGVVVYGRVNEVMEEDFDRLFAVNVKAVLFIIQHGLQRLRDGARIINVSSAGAYMASPMATMYTMTKGAISTLTRTLAWDLGDRNISANAVAPNKISLHICCMFFLSLNVLTGATARSSVDPNSHNHPTDDTNFQ